MNVKWFKTKQEGTFQTRDPQEESSKRFLQENVKKNISLQKIFPKICPLQFQLHFKTHTCSEGDTIKNFIQQKNWENNLL